MIPIEQLVDIPAVGLPRWSPQADHQIAFLRDEPGRGWLLAFSDVASGTRCIGGEQVLMASPPAWSLEGDEVAVNTLSTLKRVTRSGTDTIVSIAIDGTCSGVPSICELADSCAGLSQPRRDQLFP